MLPLRYTSTRPSVRYSNLSPSELTMWCFSSVVFSWQTNGSYDEKLVQFPGMVLPAVAFSRADAFRRRLPIAVELPPSSSSRCPP
eukprot:7389667-Prymnesium_polylepis.2